MEKLDKTKESLTFVANEIKRISLNKNFGEGITLSNNIISHLENEENNKFENLFDLIDRIYNLIDELKFLIEVETRYILFPLPDIKKEAYEIGKKYVNNFLEWVKPEDEPGELTGILEDQIYILENLKQILSKIVSQKDFN